MDWHLLVRNAAELFSLQLLFLKWYEREKMMHIALNENILLLWLHYFMKTFINNF